LGEWVEVEDQCENFIVIYDEIEDVSESIQIDLFSRSQQLSITELFRVLRHHILVALSEISILAHIMNAHLCLSVVALTCRALFALQRNFDDLTKSTLVDILVVLVD